MSCNGSCCAVFYLPHSWEEFQRRQATIHDGGLIADMIIPLTPDQARARGERFGVEVESDGPHFTCRHWDEDTRLCRIYEDRPEMCRDYPYDHDCRHGCDFVSTPDVIAKWKAVRAKREAEAQ